MKGLLHTVHKTTPILMALLAAGACQTESRVTEPAQQQQRDSTRAKQTGDQDAAPALDDADVAAAVEREILRDPSVNLRDIDVKVTDGIVELTGRVKHLLAISRATLAAADVKGVRAVDNQLRADVPKRDDETLKEAVLASLALDPTVERFEVNVDVHDQVVTLSGTVQSQPERTWAERDARGVIGVRSVENSVEVVYPGKRTDAEMRGDVLDRLRWDETLRDGLIVVKVKDAHVTLSGYVGSLGEKLRAKQEAWVAGVKGVSSDELEVKWWAKDENARHWKNGDYTDEQIASAIRLAFCFDPRLKDSDVTPTVSAGVATLAGTALNLRAKQTAQEIAENAAGVVRVNNLVKVERGDTASSSRSDPGLNKANTQFKCTSLMYKCI
jgi:osmotically-inducible protein OsmY